MIIKKEEWYNCKICNLDIDYICKKYGGGGKYKTDSFKTHLKKDHNLNLEDYFTKRPKCKCGICNKTVKISKKGSNFYYRDYACGRNKGVLKWSKEAKISRRGKNNPMYKMKPWNKGLNKEKSKAVKLISEKLKGNKVSLETRKKQSDSARKRKIHGHTGYKHSKENKERFKLNTLKMISDGKFKHTKTECHIRFENILKKLEIKYEDEFVVEYWSFDFYLPEYNFYIEIDGDYWHSNPKFYPDGPKTKAQKINYTRNISKNNFCIKNNLNLLRFWENQIINNEKDIICNLKKLLE